jgi:imidazolonepropionase-like amidohydrolase
MNRLVTPSMFIVAFALAGCTELAAPPVRAAQPGMSEEAPPPRAAPDGLVITNVMVIDVAVGKAVPKQTVVVKGERITAVVPAGTVGIPTGAKVIDGTGKFLIPGLWDMHVHVADKAYADWFLRYGVTGVRHMFAINPLQPVAKPVDAGGPVTPRLVVANQILDGPETPFKWPLRTNVVTAGDAKTGRAAVRETKKKGNDLVKVYTWLPREAYFAAVAEAKELGIPVGGHIPISITVAEASDARQLTVEHLDGIAILCSALEERHFADLRALGSSKTDAATGWRSYVEAHKHFDRDKADALFKKFVKNGTWHVPTLIQTWQMARLADEHAIPADVEKELPGFLTVFWQREITPEGVRMPNMGVRFDKKDLKAREALIRGDIEMVRRMHKAGVRLLAGTDTSAPLVVPGLALHEELGLLWSRPGSIRPRHCGRPHSTRPGA